MTEEEFLDKVGSFLRRYGVVHQLPKISLDSQSRILPFIVQTEKQRYAVFAFRWKKSIGTNTIIRTEHMLKDLNCDGAIVIGPKFSQNSFDLVNDINNRGDAHIILLSFSDIDEIMKIAR
ncbi:MAG: hypothetical protein ACTSYD_09815 [Candidatus Heimdallarchaeaceae archaeon]